MPLSFRPARALAVPVLAALVGLGGAAAARDVRVEAVDGSVHAGRLTAWDGEALALSTAQGPWRVPADEVVLVTAVPGESQPGRAAPRATLGDVVLLAPAEGQQPDRLAGRLEGGDDYGVVLDLGAEASVDLPFDVIERILPRVTRPLDRLMGLQGGGFDDRVWRPGREGGLDGLTGVVARVEAGQVVLESGLGEVSFELFDVLAVILAATEHPGGDLGAEGTRPVVRVATSGGSLFAAGLLGVEDGRLGLVTAFAEELWLPLEEVDSVWVEAPERLPLQRARLLKAEESSSLGGDDDVLFPWRRDVSVSGRGLALDGVQRAGGFGVHALCRLVLEVPEGARSARVRVGLSDEVAELAAEGSVRCELRVDGRTVALAQDLREGEPSVVLRSGPLPSGARVLELVTEDGGDLDAGDRVAWVDGWFELAADG